ncbi:MAG: hypothetical protein BWY72_01909 [Bacteroidetes bacterium ADurb.Bin416]|nr:MAG: hypothetical protein BWY72_01909 [Bacteroidetes bacterium ADurb.Bin416]
MKADEFLQFRLSQRFNGSTSAIGGFQVGGESLIIGSHHGKDAFTIDHGLKTGQVDTLQENGIIAPVLQYFVDTAFQPIRFLVVIGQFIVARHCH